MRKMILFVKNPSHIYRDSRRVVQFHSKEQSIEEKFQELNQDYCIRENRFNK